MAVETKPSALIIGSGAREHAIGWKMLDHKLFFAPGNGGTELLGQNLDIAATDVNKLTEWAVTNNVNYTVVGPEASLEKGVVDSFQEESKEIFGPTAKAARLETSKAAAIERMIRWNIPHPYSEISADVEEIHAMIDNWHFDTLPVLKADELAAGKAVVLPENVEDAHAWANLMMVDHVFPNAGYKLILQERLEGKELSVMAFSDGKNVFPMLPARDFKRRYSSDHEGDNPNTGGMASYTAEGMISDEMLQEILETILQPAVTGMAEEGTPYTGVLYAGLMLTDKGPTALEFNARFGDPESPVVLALLQSRLSYILKACTSGNLRQEDIRFRRGAAVGLEVVHDNYPRESSKGKKITGLNQTLPYGTIFHAGTTRKNEEFYTSGGRIVLPTGWGPDIETAYNRANKISQRIDFEGASRRGDILERIKEQMQ